ncbi:MAG: sulfate reduction electron transfer complex DsrMKJOP subunit DsrO [Pseudomonadota bacterium]|jgi:molybdopterin-containing oxidoreductase family iron-sulfur binding subunit
MSQPQDKSRRNFVGTAAVAGAGLGTLALAPGLHLIQVSEANTPSQGASGKVRWGMLIDTTKCASGCDACVKACNTENGINETLKDARQGSQWIRKIDLKNPKTGQEHSLPMLCQHCAHPPCVDVCPTGASMKRADGIVLVDRHTCIGCRYCMLACPYKARSLVHLPLTNQNPEVPRGQGCVESCTFCVQRVDKGLKPACVESCPEGAMLFGDLNDPASEIAQRIANEKTTQVRGDLKLNLGVRYQGI